MRIFLGSNSLSSNPVLELHLCSSLPVNMTVSRTDQSSSASIDSSTAISRLLLSSFSHMDFYTLSHLQLTLG